MWWDVKIKDEIECPVCGNKEEDYEIFDRNEEVVEFECGVCETE